MMPKICYVVTVPVTIRAFFIPQLKFLADNGFDVSVVCSNDDTLQEELGEKIKYYPMEIPRGISFCGSLKAIQQLSCYFKKEKFDLIQYSTPNAAMYASIAGKIAKVRVRNYHLMGFRYLGASGTSRIILKWIEKTACNNSTSIECVSRSNLEVGVKEGIFTREKATVVWNGSSGGIDLARFDIKKRFEYRSEIRDKLHLSSEDFVFGFVGRITKDKGINEILEAFTKIDNAKLLLVGDPEGIDTLDSVLYQSSLKNNDIYYTGSVSEVEKYYAAIDVLVFPSYREGFGNVVIEAAAMGTPAIISNIPGPIDAVVPDKTARIIEAKNSNMLLTAMNEFDNEKARKMGNAASEYVAQSFDSNVLINYIFERKKQLLTKHSI